MMSMTGFGRAQGTTQGRAVVVEIRSVNHRALDVKVRGRNLGASVEVEIIRAVRATLARGSVQVSMDEMSQGGEGGDEGGRSGTAGIQVERIRRRSPPWNNCAGSWVCPSPWIWQRWPAS